jgi:hypothetical protein
MREAIVFSAWMVLTMGVAVAQGPTVSPTPSQTAPAPADTAAGPLTPEQIYLRSMKAMKAEAIPPYVQFREDVTARNLQLSCGDHGATLTLKHGDMQRVSLVSYRSKDGVAVSVDKTTGKRCELALLYPAGTGLNSLDTATPKPAVSPTPGPAAPPDDNGLKLVGAVRVEGARFYKISLAGTEPIDGHPAYHLQLSAYRDPLEHPLTDLWVDPDSFLVRRARGEAAAHFVVGSGRFEGTLTFNRIGGFWVVHDEDFSAAANAFLIHARTHLTAHGSDFSFPADLPGVFPSPSPSPAAKTRPPAKG